MPRRTKMNAVERLHREFGGITASMAATICGANPWESAYDLYMRMIGREPPKRQTFEMWLGSNMEGVIIRAFSRETGMKVRRPRRAVDQEFWFTTEEYGFPMGALLDGITEDDTGPAVVEAKHVSGYAARDWQYEPPLMYWIQLQHQLACTGWRSAYICALAGKKLIWMRVKRDDEIIAMITDAERDFYRCVQDGRPPSGEWSAWTTGVASGRSDASTRTTTLSTVIDDPEVERLAAKYVAQGKAVEALRREREHTRNLLLSLVGEAESVSSGEYVIHAHDHSRSYIDIDRMKKDYPEIVQRYTKDRTVCSVRVQRIRGEEDGE